MVASSSAAMLNEMGISSLNGPAAQARKSGVLRLSGAVNASGEAKRKQRHYDGGESISSTNP